MTTVYLGTIEYLDITVTCDVALDTQPVEMSFDRVNWYSGSWQGAPATTRTFRVLIGSDVPLTTGSQPVYVRVHNDPEIPIFNVGQLQVQ